jgi:hypothetical protein
MFLLGKCSSGFSTSRLEQSVIGLKTLALFHTEQIHKNPVTERFMSIGEARHEG